MTESEWWECRNPDRMLNWLRDTGSSSERKLTLFAVALCRSVLHLLTNHHVRHSRTAIDVWERHADGLATNEELRTAAFGAKVDALDAAHAVAHPGETDFYAVSSAAEAVAHIGDASATARDTARAIAYETLSKVYDDTVAAIVASWKVQGYLGRSQWDGDEARAAGTPDFRAAHDTERAAQCGILCDLFGPLPFRDVLISASILKWNNGIIVRMAAAIYEERCLPNGTLDRARLAVLADALEEAGIKDAGLLEHLRGPGPHVRGCFVVDAILGRH